MEENRCGGISSFNTVSFLCHTQGIGEGLLDRHLGKRTAAYGTPKYAACAGIIQ